MRVKAKKKTTKQSLTMQQRVEIFCQAIMQTKSQSDAYRLAFPNCKKWKPETIHNKASKFAKLDEVVARLAELSDTQLNRYEASIDRVLQELSRIAFFNPKKLFNENGEPIPIHELPDEVAAVIGGFEFMQSNDKENQEEYLRRLKLVGKEKGLEMLGRWFDMWAKNHVPTPTPQPAGPQFSVVS